MNPEFSTVGSTVSSRVHPRCCRSLGYVLPRLVCMAIGPGLMMILSVLKLETQSGQPGIIDACFVGVVVAILAIRWVAWLAGDKYDSFGRKTTLMGTLGFTGVTIALVGSFWGLTSLLASQPLSS